MHTHVQKCVTILVFSFYFPFPWYRFRLCPSRALLAALLGPSAGPLVGPAGGPGEVLWRAWEGFGSFLGGLAIR